MKYIKNTLDFHVEEPTVISLGKFDGIHRGHELLMEKLAQKKEEGLKAAIFTFDIPPKKNVEHIEAKVLTTNEEKMHIFEGIGIDYLIECPFTREVMCMEPEDFIRMLVEKLNVKCIVAGEDFHFGHNRRGDYQMLKRYAPVDHLHLVFRDLVLLLLLVPHALHQRILLLYFAFFEKLCLQIQKSHAI